MKIVLATGIYPPDIGGPATYVRALATEFKNFGHDVRVITFAEDLSEPLAQASFPVERVKKSGGPLFRWSRYASSLKKIATDADIIYAFSSVSTGVPLLLSGLKKPKRVLRLGGDFFWERYTDSGGKKTLRDWTASSGVSRSLMGKVLSGFDQLIFSTRFQEELYEKHFKALPNHNVLENALSLQTERFDHSSPHTPLRLLFVGRFVGFKNLIVLIETLREIPDVVLTVVGDGPMKNAMLSLVEDLALEQRVMFVGPVQGKEKEEIFHSHDILILPSLTEISPNVALEASAAGLPVLLTEETGLSEVLRSGMTIRRMQSSSDIASAIKDVQSTYPVTDAKPAERSWRTVAEETLSLFQSLV